MEGAGRSSYLLARGVKAARAVWWFLRQVSGDAAYENYLGSQQRKGVAAPSGICEAPEGNLPAPVLSRQEFYLDALRRRYSAVSRCC
jgi:uncharacterized short protein YbdD (DUF466 family)